MDKTITVAAIAGLVALIAGVSVATLEQAQAQMPTQASESLIDIEEDTPIGTVTEDYESAPTVTLVSIDRYKPSTAREEINYRITFAVTAGVSDLRDIEFDFSSDLGSFDYEISSLNALKTSMNVVRIKAIDPDSIQGELVGYSLTGPTSTGPGGEPLGPR